MKFSDKIALERFYKYAFSCLYQKYTRKEITREKFRDLRECYHKGNLPDDEELRDLFPTAIQALEDLAKERNKSSLDSELVDYFWGSDNSGGHNCFISARKGVYNLLPEHLNEQCKVHLAEVVERKGKLRAIVKHNGKEEKVSTFLIPNIKTGDKVKIHLHYAIEKV